MLAAPDVLLDTWERVASAPPVTRSIELLAAVNGWERSEVASQTLGEHNRLLLETGYRLDGSLPRLVAHCPACDAEVEVEVPVQAMAETPAVIPGLVRLPIAGGEVELRPVTPADLEKALRCQDHDSARQSVLAACVSIIGDTTVDEHELTAALAELDDGANLELDVGCPECGHRWPADLDVGLLAWAALDRVAVDLLHQVEVLAGRYGWSESDILAMGARRRSFYTEGVL